MSAKPPVWSTTEPTEPGHYWERGPGWVSLGITPHVREFTRGTLPPGIPGMEWAGPIPRPAEPEPVPAPPVRSCTTCALGACGEADEAAVCDGCAPPVWSGWRPEPGEPGGEG